MEKTIVSIETIDGEKLCHFLGYGFICEAGATTPAAQFVEYCGLYLPLAFVIENGMNRCESECGPEVKQYITDFETTEELDEVYNFANHGTAPICMDESSMTMDMTEGIYVISYTVQE